MNNADTELFEQAQLLFRGPDYVRRNYPIVEKTDACQIIDRTGAFSFQTVIHFPLCFGNMRNNRSAGSIRKSARSFQMFFRDRVWRVRRDRRDYQGIAFPMTDEPFDISH